MNFTPEQQHIFQFVRQQGGHGIIDAVAGAGKTTTIMECAKFVADKSSVLFCAFNKSIAQEIKRRFHTMGLGQVDVHTIHALGWQMLKANTKTGKAPVLKDNKYRELLHSAAVQERMESHIEIIIALNGLDKDSLGRNQQFAVKNLVHAIHNRLLDMNQKYRATLTKDAFAEFEKMVAHFNIFNTIERAANLFKKELAAYFECHKILLAEGNRLSEETMIMDFTDMLYLPYLWKLEPVKKYAFLFIDECQDLSVAQFAVAAKHGKKDGRILAVGDPHQSIYGFTGADIDSFNRVKEYTKATQLPLTTCFRCPQQVIQLAQQIRPDITGSKPEPGLVSDILFEQVVPLAKPGNLIISRLKAPLVLLVFEFIDKDQKVRIAEDEANDILNEIKNIFKTQELSAVIPEMEGGFASLREEVMGRWKYIIIKNAERIPDSIERKYT